MLHFFLSLIIFAAATFLLALSVRYGIAGAGRLDNWIVSRSGRRLEGFDWYFRIPTTAGAVPEYFYAMVLTREQYFNTNWWALKISSFISVLLFIALLNSRSGVESYYSFEMIRTQGLAAIFTFGTFFWYMNIISLLITVLIVLITVESIKMTGSYALLRAPVYLLLSLLMAAFTVAMLFVIVFMTAIYIIWKIISFLFITNRDSGNFSEKGEETAEDILRSGFLVFKRDLNEWTSRRKSRGTQDKVSEHKKTSLIKQKREVQSSSIFGDDTDIPRLYPD